jgi:putative FmdB family regulatory protein
MPIYEYACRCGTVFETLVVRRADEDEIACPACGREDVERLMSRPAPSRTEGSGPGGGGACGPVG